MHGELWLPEYSISVSQAIAMTRGIVYWMEIGMCMYSYDTKSEAATLNASALVAYDPTRCRILEGSSGVCMRSKKTCPHIEVHNVEHCVGECSR